MQSMGKPDGPAPTERTATERTSAQHTATARIVPAPPVPGSYWMESVLSGAIQTIIVDSQQYYLQRAEEYKQQKNYAHHYMMLAIYEHAIPHVVSVLQQYMKHVVARQVEYEQQRILEH